MFGQKIVKKNVGFCPLSQARHKGGTTGQRRQEQPSEPGLTQGSRGRSPDAPVLLRESGSPNDNFLKKLLKTTIKTKGQPKSPLA